MRKSTMYVQLPLFVVLALQLFRPVCFAQTESSHSLSGNSQHSADVIRNIRNITFRSANEGMIEARSLLSDSDNALQNNPLAFYNIAFVHYFTGQNDSAIYYCDRSIEICREANQGWLLGRTIALKALIHSSKDQKAIAYQMQREALELCESAGDQEGVAFVIKDIAYSISALSNEQVRSYLNEALSYYSQSGDSAQVGILLNNIGLSYFYDRTQDSALAYFCQARAIGARINSPYILGLSENNMGMVLEFGFGSSDQQVESHYLNSLLYYKQCGSAKIQFVYAALATFYLSHGNHDEAEIYLSQFMEIARATGSRFLICRALYLYSQFYESKKDFEQAYHYQELYIYELDTLHQNANSSTIAEMEMRFQSKLNQKRIESLAQQNEIGQLRVTESRYYIGILALLLVFCLSLIFLIVRSNRLKALRFKTELDRKLLVSNMQSLRAQMNPHFVFNALNAIQGLVNTHENTKASRYLTKFSKLARGILTHSEFNHVRLEEEIEFIRNYIEVQSLRFSDGFSYQTEVVHEDEISDLKIPSMILQPIIENAIDHGLFNKTGEKKLHIRIAADEHVINISVVDNGMGFSSPVKNLSWRNDHRSKGIENIRERLNLMEKYTSQKCSIEIIDLADNSGNTGTRVDLRIPIM